MFNGNKTIKKKVCRQHQGGGLWLTRGMEMFASRPCSEELGLGSSLIQQRVYCRAELCSEVFGRHRAASYRVEARALCDPTEGVLK